MTHDTGVAQTTHLQKAALAVAATFALVGILGFIPGVTTNYDQMELIGHESGAELLGIFGVSVFHNVVHLLFGLVGFALARSWDGARMYLIGGGAIYLLLALYGVLVDRHEDANFIPVNAADNWLHLVLGAAMIILGVVLSKKVRDRH